MEHIDNCDGAQALLAPRVANLPENRRAGLSPLIDDLAQSSHGDDRAMPIRIRPQSREGVDNG
jgi:hypothetical protein